MHSSTEVLGNRAKIGRQSSDYYTCALLEFLKLHLDLERTLEKCSTHRDILNIYLCIEDM